MKEANGMDHGQCLTDELLTEYLEGALDPAITAACEGHLIACDRCREELVLYMRVMHSDVAPGEQAHIDQISDLWERRESSRPATPVAWSPRRRFFLSLVAIAAATVFVVLGFWKSTPNPAEPQSARDVVHLLLAQGRPFELRLDEQPYMPIVRTRGPETPGVDYGLIAEGMSRMAADSYAMGVLYLLQKDFDRAASELEKAEKQPGVVSAVHNDLGVAYLERGGEINVKRAGEEFRRALQLDSNFPPAVFNLAIFYEREGEGRQAEAEWRKYLELDSSSGWAGEARSKLESLSH